MKVSRLALITIMAALVATACNKDTGVGANRSATPAATQAPAGAANKPDEFAGARTTYAKNCANCHGDNGQGGVAEIDGKKIKGPSFRAGHSLKHSDEDFLKQITKGGDGMPAYADKLSAKEIDDLIHFIRLEFQKKGNP